MHNYSIQIFQASEYQVKQIDEILGVKSSKDKWWQCEVVQNDDGPPFFFVDTFLSILDGKYEQLKEIGISREDITFWVLYEYEDQCNLEFNPEEMAKMGKEGITLCISCWEK